MEKIQLLGKEIGVLNKGFVCLDASLADDLSVANAARVSVHNHTDEMDDASTGLISYLMKNEHGTPFEHNMMRFRIKAPIFIFREWHRHRIGHSYNEWSARYSEMSPDFHIPEAQDVRGQVGKPGHYTYEPAGADVAKWFRDNLIMNSHRGYDLYQEALQRGIAKEQAREFLSFNLYSEMYWTCNARSMMAFLNLRNSKFALREFQYYAEVIEYIFSKLMPVTHAAFIKNERNAP